MKKILALVLCLCLVFSLGAFGAEAFADGETVVVAIGAGFNTLDPGRVYEKYPPLVVNACYENLFKFYSNDGGAEPCLAESYSFSDDGLTLTVTLKDSVFSSGNPVTSTDVKFSIERCRNLQDNPAFITDTIESIDTPDAKTVVFHLTQVDSAILSKLTYSSLAVLDSEVVKANGGTDAPDAVTADTASEYLNSTSAGSGMYVMTSYIPDEEIVLEKNPNYTGEATNVDKYIVLIQPDSNTQMMTLSSGDIDVAMNMTDDTMEELAGLDDIVLGKGRRFLLVDDLFMEKRDMPGLVKKNLALLERIHVDMLELINDPVTLDELVVSVMYGLGIRFRDETRNGYLKNTISQRVRYLVETGRLCRIESDGEIRYGKT